LQKKRWKGQFDDVKQRFLNNIEVDRIGKVSKDRSQYVQRKPNFHIPSKFLPLDKRPIPNNMNAGQEQLRRDKINAYKLNRYNSMSPDGSPLQKPRKLNALSNGSVNQSTEDYAQMMTP